MEQYLQSLGNFDIWVKVVLGTLTAPLWIPAFRTIWSEMQNALAEDGGFLGRSETKEITRRPPELDPFLNVPHEHLQGGQQRNARRF